MNNPGVIRHFIRGNDPAINALLPGRIIFFVLLISMFFLTPAHATTNVTSFKHVLLLQSYFYGHPWEEDVSKGVRTVFDHSDVKIRLSIDYMDTKRSKSALHYRNLTALYREKYKKDKFDVILANDDNALFFALDHRQELFDNAPVVFLGLSHYPKQELAREKNVTGIVQTLEFKKTLELAIKMHPGLRHFIVINDSSASGKKRRPQILNALSHLSQKIPYEYYDDKSFAELSEILKQADKDTVLLLHLLDRDSTGASFSKKQVFDMVNSSFNGPVYATKKDYIEYGIVGGYLSDGYTHGEKAAELVLRVLKGGSPEDIPVVSNDVDPPAFAYDCLQKFSLSEDDLPPGCKIYNKPFSFYESYKTQIWLLSIIFILLLVSVIALALYIIMRKKDELEKQHLRSMLQNVVDSMPSLIVGVDVKGEIIQFNLEAQRKSGVSSQLARGKKLEDIFPHLMNKLELVRKSIQERKPYYDIKVSREEDGDMNYEDITIYPLVTNGVEGAVIRVDDVTHQTELEQRLAQSQKMEAIGQIAGGVAHDFNNMLAGILGAVELMSMSIDEENKQYLDIISKASGRAADLIAKLLLFSRKGNVVAESLNIHKTIENTITLLESSIDKKIEIKVTPEAGHCYTEGRDTQLQNVFLNIGINAGHAMPEGGTLSFSTKNILLDSAFCESSLFEIVPGEYIQVSIRDSGTGINPKDLPRIFDPFFTTKDQGKGTGLGLSAVYGTIKNHQGAITVYSELGVGTVFHVFLPVSEQIDEIYKPHEMPVSGHGLILVVDDEEIIRTTTRALLENLHYDVLLAENGVQAIEIYQEKGRDIDLILLDMVMPDMNGREVFTKIRSINNTAKIIIASGFSRNEDVAGLKEQGLCAFLPKPFHYIELSRVIADVLGIDPQ